MGSLSKFFADHSDLLAEAFDLDAESNLVEKDHISAAAVESLVHDLLVNEMQDILTELIIPAGRDNRGYQRMGGGTQASNPDQGQWSELPADFVAARRAQTGEGPPPGAGGAAGGRGGGGGAGGAGQPMQAGVGGSIPTQVVSILKGRGWSDSAIKGALANAMTEGGLTEPWKKAGGGENSFGIWQFNRNGELPGYYAWAKQNGIDNPDGHIAGQTNYMASRVEQMIPGYAQHKDDRAATDDFHIKFERPADKTPGSRYQWLGAAQQHFDSALKNMASSSTGQQTTTPQGSERFNLGNRAGNLNQTLIQSVRAGSSYLPDGYSVGVTSGERPGAHVHGGGGPSQHSTGNAVDVHIIGPDGQIIPNRGEDTTGMYGMLARGSYHELLKTNPDMAGKMAWGGNFTTSASGGDKDLMHIDLGGDRGRFGSLSQQYQQHAQSDNFNARAQQATQTAQTAQTAQTTQKPTSIAAAQTPDDDIAKIVAPKVATAQSTPPPTPPKTPPPNLQASAGDDIAKIVAPQQSAAAPPPPVTASAPPPKSAVPPPTDDIAKIVAPQVPPATAAAVPPVTPPAKLVSWAVPSTRGRLGIQLLRS